MNLVDEHHLEFCYNIFDKFLQKYNIEIQFRHINTSY